jgi:outer membrane lipoprotein-sorting protein
MKMKSIKMVTLTLLFLFASAQFNVFAQDSLEISKQKAKEVIEKYLTAIGGRDALAKVEDRTTIMRGTAMGQSITLIAKQKAPNKLRQEIKAGGMEQLVVFDGEKGVMNAMNQKIDVKDKELEALKIEAIMEFLLDPESHGIKISYEGSEKINSKDANKIKMVLPSGLRWFSYFDNESGLKVKEEKELQTQMGLMNQTFSFDDYKEVDGIKYPHKIVQSAGGQTIDVTVSSIKVNKGLSDDIFIIVE